MFQYKFMIFMEHNMPVFKKQLPMLTLLFTIGF